MDESISYTFLALFMTGLSWKVVTFFIKLETNLMFLEDKLRYSNLKIEILEKKVSDLEDFKFKIYDNNLFSKGDQWSELSESEFSDENNLSD